MEGWKKGGWLACARVPDRAHRALGGASRFGRPEQGRRRGRRRKVTLDVAEGHQGREGATTTAAATTANTLYIPPLALRNAGIHAPFSSSRYFSLLPVPSSARRRSGSWLLLVCPASTTSCTDPFVWTRREELGG